MRRFWLMDPGDHDPPMALVMAADILPRKLAEQRFRVALQCHGLVERDTERFVALSLRFSGRALGDPDDDGVRNDGSALVDRWHRCL